MKIVYSCLFNLFMLLGLGACQIHSGSPNFAPDTVSGSLKSYTATVSKVADGDTLTVLDGNGNSHKIRLAYIDAPELKQAHGTHSRDALIQQIRGKTVQIVVTDTDRYKREVAQIFIGNHDVNLQQIQQGNAWHYREYAKKQTPHDFARYQTAEQFAKQKRLGLWQNHQALEPWTYRQQQRKKQP